MRILVDSHALLWYALGDPRLSATAEAAVRDPAHEVLVSPATLWELAIKVSIGKLALNGIAFDELIDRCENQCGFGLLPITPAHTAAVATLPFPSKHKDPFDRLLIAQAIVEAIPIVSADGAFDDYSVSRIW